MGGCFVNGTEIVVSRNAQTCNVNNTAIEDLKCGDSVISYNLETKAFESSMINDIIAIKYNVNKLVTVKFDDGTSVICTPSHPFWCQNKNNYCSPDNDYNNYKYKCEKYDTLFGKLSIGDTVFNAQSQYIKVSQIEWNNIIGGGVGDINNVDNFNVTVRTLSLSGGVHNFFANGILVHNKT